MEPFRGERGDRTLCDRDAGFTPAQMQDVPELIRRGIAAGLIGKGDIIWSIADSGWIYEARVTNRVQSEYHGFPLRPNEDIARKVAERFAAWVKAAPDRKRDYELALRNCHHRYKFHDDQLAD